MTVLTQSTKTAATLVEFGYGNPVVPTFRRYTDWTNDLALAGATYLSEPRLEIDPIENSGVLNVGPARVVIPRDGFGDQISNGEPHSPIFLKISERSERAGVAVVQVLFYGRVSRAIRNYQGNPERVYCEAVSFKQLLDVALGVICEQDCGHTFGSEGCGIDLGLLIEEGAIAFIDGATVTITGLGAHADRYWHRGYVEHQGLRLSIREWVNGTSFQLVREPPSSWTNQLVRVTPGCDLQLPTCKDRWNNEDSFLGLGYAMQPYNPTLETP